MSLVSVEDIIKAAQLEKFGFMKQGIAKALMGITRLNKVNSLYDEFKPYHGEAFFDKFLERLGINYEIFEEDLNKIPKTGPFVIVANHPLGAIDGVVMCHAICKIRPDFKVMGNFLLSKIVPMRDHIIAVNPFSENKEAYSSVNGMRAAMQHLKDGHCMGVFPAGEVSNKNNEDRELIDGEWQTPLLKLVKKLNVPVIPMYFHAKNSNFFYQATRLVPALQTALLPSEMVKKREKPIKIRIGKAISPKAQTEYETPQELGEYLKKRVYLLKSFYDQKRKLMDLFKLPNMPIKLSGSKQEPIQNIIDETSAEDLAKDINTIKKNGGLLFAQGSYEVLFSTADEIPYLMREIGRQREITFRAVGEGTNLPFDLDEYDKHYHHLLLWDSQAQKLAGAYRMALGGEVMKKYGINGFYTSSLFEFDQEIQPFFKKVIEMGRAYITAEYQQKPMPLFLLWRGIVHVCLRHPDHKFLMGGVSISNQFSDFSKSLMIEFMRSHHYDGAVAQYIHPKNEFKVRLKDRDRTAFFEEAKNDLNKFDKLIDDLEPQLRMPVLIKKYIKQNARVVAFNVDPSFNDAIDGLMYIRISDLPDETTQPVLEEMAKIFESENQ
jgi:putative hemolysin